MNFIKWEIFAAACMLVSAPLCASAQDAGDRTKDTLQFYVSADGSDKADGQSRSTALASLSRVQELLKARKGGPAPKHVQISFLPGVYHGQSVMWDYYSPGTDITIESADRQPGRHPAVMDAKGTDATSFFVLRITEKSDRPIRTAITIRGLQISNYCEGISLGDWKSVATVAGNTIEGNVFSEIGSRFQSPSAQADGKKKPMGDCVAAVRVQNAQDNLIRANTFRNIQNLPAKETVVAKYGPYLLHSIYLSKGASNNRIEKNSFEGFSGSPVRIRAQSDNNKVIDNRFSKPVYVDYRPAGYRINVVSQWYCNEAVEACTERLKKGDFECPSIGTEIVGNTLEGDLDLYKDESQSRKVVCPLPGRQGDASLPKLDHNSGGAGR
jgi:hypothetical protein